MQASRTARLVPRRKNRSKAHINNRGAIPDCCLGPPSTLPHLHLGLFLAPGPLLCQPRAVGLHSRTHQTRQHGGIWAHALCGVVPIQCCSRHSGATTGGRGQLQGPPSRLTASAACLSLHQPADIQPAHLHRHAPPLPTHRLRCRLLLLLHVPRLAQHLGHRAGVQHNHLRLQEGAVKEREALHSISTLPTRSQVRAPTRPSALAAPG